MNRIFRRLMTGCRSINRYGRWGIYQTVQAAIVFYNILPTAFQLLIGVFIGILFSLHIILFFKLFFSKAYLGCIHFFKWMSKVIGPPSNVCQGVNLKIKLLTQTDLLLRTKNVTWNWCTITQARIQLHWSSTLPAQMDMNTILTKRVRLSQRYYEFTHFFLLYCLTLSKLVHFKTNEVYFKEFNDRFYGA